MVGSGKFVITVSSRINARPIENIVLSLYLGDGTTGVSATATGEKRGPMNGGAGGRTDDAAGAVGGGSWEWDPNTKVIKAMLIGRYCWRVGGRSDGVCISPPSD